MSEKVDMSLFCGTGQQGMWIKRNKGEITEKEFIEWYEQNCAKCKYEYVGCMFGEI